MFRPDLDKAFTGKIMTVSGNVGSGKNALAVALIRVMSRKCIHGILIEKDCEYCKKYSISQDERIIRAYSNFHIGLTYEEILKEPEFSKDFPKKKYSKSKGEFRFLPIKKKDGHYVFVECVYLDTVEDFIRIPKLKRHCICILDEPNAWGFDSRSSMSPQNRAIGYKIQHTRHYNLDIVFLTQLWSMVDLRGKRLSSDTVVAITPDRVEFQYGLHKNDDWISLTMSKNYARKNVFPYYDSSEIIGQNIPLEDETEPEPETPKQVTQLEIVN